ncbi:MAG: M56 family metallopeptidase, partial [Mucilaginibacter sp.]
MFFSIVTGIVLLLSKRSAAAHRYNLVLSLFFGFITACALTFTYEWKSEPAAAVLTPIAGNIPVNVSSLLSGNTHNIKQVINAFTAYFSSNAPFIILLWFMVFLFKSVKMISCLAYNQRIRNYQVYPASAFWEEKVARFSKKLNIRKAVRLLQSGYVKMPVVVGHLKPVILVPVGLMAGLPVEQVEAILLHELAHIKRNDYFVNFFQNVAEAVFFFNPGLLWISSLLREERENCADDIAVAETNNKIDFVQALVSFKEHQLYGSGYATAFAGKKNYLLRRASRILGTQNKTFGLGEKIFFTASILLFGLVVTGAAVARVKEYNKETVRTAARYNAAVMQPGRVSPVTGAEKARPAKRHHNLAGTIKMKPGIAGINDNAVPAPKLSDNPEQVVAVNPAPAPVAAGRTVEAPVLQADKDRIAANLNRAQAEADRQAA